MHVMDGNLSVIRLLFCGSSAVEDLNNTVDLFRPAQSSGITVQSVTFPDAETALVERSRAFVVLLVMSPTDYVATSLSKGVLPSEACKAWLEEARAFSALHAEFADETILADFEAVRSKPSKLAYALRDQLQSDSVPQIFSADSPAATAPNVIHQVLAFYSLRAESEVSDVWAEIRQMYSLQKPSPAFLPEPDVAAAAFEAMSRTPEGPDNCLIQLRETEKLLTVLQSELVASHDIRVVSQQNVQKLKYTILPLRKKLTSVLDSTIWRSTIPIRIFGSLVRRAVGK